MGDGSKAVSYTHLDVYKRQAPSSSSERPLSQTRYLIACAGVDGQAVGIDGEPEVFVPGPVSYTHLDGYKRQSLQ